MKKSQARSPSGARSSVRARRRRTSAPSARKASRCGSSRRRPITSPPGRRHVGLAEARQQRPGEQERRADALGQRRRRPRVRVTLVGAAARPRARRATRRCTPRSLEQREHRLHVADARHVAQHDLLLGQQRGREDRQRGVLVAGGHDRARERVPAFDDELLHARVRPGRDRAGGKGTEGHLPQVRAGRRIPCPAWPPTRDEAWALVERMGQSESLRKHLLGVEAGDARLRAQVGRGRGALRGHRPAPRPRLRALPGPRHGPPAQGARAVRASRATRRS